VRMGSHMLTGHEKSLGSGEVIHGRREKMRSILYSGLHSHFHIL
jgi:hypothetical protein